MELLIIEAGRGTVGFVRFLKKGGAFFFQGAKRSKLEDDGSLSSLLQDVAADEAGEQKIFLSLDAENIFFRELLLPITDRRKQREVLPLELKGETAMDVEKLVFDSLPLADGKGYGDLGRSGRSQDKNSSSPRSGSGAAGRGFFPVSLAASNSRDYW